MEKSFGYPVLLKIHSTLLDINVSVLQWISPLALDPNSAGLVDIDVIISKNNR